MNGPNATSTERRTNPLLFVVFCPHCVASGLFALTAAGFVTMPAFFGVRFEYYLAPAIVLGTLLAWLAWGRWHRARETCMVEPAGVSDRA